AFVVRLVRRHPDNLDLLRRDGSSVNAAEDFYTEAQFQQKVIEICFGLDGVTRSIRELVFGAGGDTEGDSTRHFSYRLSVEVNNPSLLVFFDQPPRFELLRFRRGHQGNLQFRGTQNKQVSAERDCRIKCP